MTILIVDHQEITLVGTKTLLSQDPKIKILGETRKGRDVLQLAKTLNPELVILDIYMPDIDGMEIVRKLLVFNPSLKILATGTGENTLYPICLLELGGAGYISKEELPRELFQAIRIVLKGHIYLSPAIAQKIALQSVHREPYATLQLLSLRELQITLLLLQGKKIKEIAEILSVKEKTIIGYRREIFRKLNIRNEVELILLIKEIGLLDSLHY